MKQVSVILLGCGLVGKAVLRQLNKVNTVNKAVSFSVVAVSESDAALIPALGTTKIDTNALLDFKATDSARISGYCGDMQVVSPNDLIDKLAAMKITPKEAAPAIMVDCTAASSTMKLMTNWVQSGGYAVMANKKPLTGTADEYNALMAPGLSGRVGYESAVGAGTPFIASLRRLVSAGDKISKIEGVFSGTMGYLMAGLEGGNKWSELVDTAHKLGYTEPHPRDDLSGTDIARKSLIMARTLGWKFEMSDIEIQPMYPEGNDNTDVNDFKSSLTKMDDEMLKLREQASASGNVLRYLATITESELKVKVMQVKADSPIGRLKGSDNIMLVTSEVYAANPLVVQGSGAGDVITAVGVVADMVQMCDN